MSNIEQKKTPELTVVVIAYNNELYVEEALESLYHQTLKDIEVVVVNDCSKDRTGEIIEEYIADKPNFRAVHLETNSGGCSVPRNTGIFHSDSKYVMFLDGDDWYTSNACEVMLNAAKRTGSDIVAGQVIRTNNYETWYKNQIYSRERTNINVREFPELIFDSLSVNKIYKREFLDRNNLRFQEGLHYEDVLFTGQAYFLANSISIIPVPVYYWRVVENAKVKSITNQRQDIKNFINRINSHRFLDKFMIDNGDAIYLSHKNNKFFRHDLRLYVNDYLDVDEDYKIQFHQLIQEYLHENINKYEFIKLAEDLRIICYLLYLGDKEAFEDYIHYLHDLPTKQLRITHNGDFYYFNSEMVPKEDQKFLKVNNPKFEIGIDDLQLTENKLKFASNVDLKSFEEKEVVLYQWELRNKSLKHSIFGKNKDGRIEFDLHDILPGNYYFYLTINFLGKAKEVLVKYDMLNKMEYIKVESNKYSISTFVNEKNMIGIKNRPHSDLTDIFWKAKKRLRKLRNKRKKNQKNNGLFTRAIKKIVYKLPVKKNWVLFESQMGKQFSDNPKYIYEELKNSNKNYKYIWSCENVNEFPVEGNVTKVKRGSLKHYYYMTRSKYWVDNQGISHLAPKKKEQIYLQTWHGTPLKKMGVDKDNATPAEMKKLKSQTKNWNYFISPNPYSTKIFKRAFKYTGNVLETGYPRNDLLVQQPELIKKKVRNHFNIPEGKKVVLYAPTFRDWNENSYFDTLRDINKLSKEINDDTIILLRLHYLLASKISQIQLPGHIINASSYSDIQELYLITDMLITDYSSVMFDYAVLKRPIIFYCYDLDEYLYYRGMYFDLKEDAPGPICTNLEEVLHFIRQPEQLEAYKNKLEQFSKTYCGIEDGQASKRVIEQVFK